jgi:hypothetical protein
MFKARSRGRAFYTISVNEYHFFFAFKSKKIAGATNPKSLSPFAPKVGGSGWIRTTDLTLIRGAL